MSGTTQPKLGKKALLDKIAKLEEQLAATQALNIALRRELNEAKAQAQITR